MREKILIYSAVIIILMIQLYQIQDLKSLMMNQNTGSFSSEKNIAELKYLSCITAVEGQGIIIKMNDSSTVAKNNENQNLYVVHDDDILRVINELRAAGAEAISINGQRLTATSEIRCAGPTLSVNNVRSSAPFEIYAIGEKKSLENAVKMRGGVAETLKVWGIKLEITTSDKILIPAYNENVRRLYAKIVD